MQAGFVILARCHADGQHLAMFRLPLHRPGKPDGPNHSTRNLPETLLDSKQVASGNTVVTSMDWLPAQPEGHLLCMGFSHGGVSLFSSLGELRISFLLCSKPVQRVRPGIEPVGSGSRCELLVLHKGGVLAAMAFVGIQPPSPSKMSEDMRSSSGQELAEGSFQYELYELGDRETTEDVCFSDAFQPLEDVFAISGCSSIIALGARPFLSQHWISGGRGESARAMLGDAASAVASYARSWLPFGKKGERNSNPKATPANLPAGMLRIYEIQVPGRGRPGVLAAAKRFLDPTRTGERLEPACLPWTPSPSIGQCALTGSQKQTNALAATSDAYGRVGLFCLETLRCLHLWKGYRDAQVAWLWPSSANGESCCSGRYTPFFTIYAPRRGLLEIWDLNCEHGPERADAAAVDVDCQLLITGQGKVVLVRPSGQVDYLKVQSKQTRSGINNITSEASSDDFGSAHSNEDTHERDTAPTEAYLSAEACSAIAGKLLSHSRNAEKTGNSTMKGESISESTEEKIETSDAAHAAVEIVSSDLPDVAGSCFTRGATL